MREVERLQQWAARVPDPAPRAFDVGDAVLATLAKTAARQASAMPFAAVAGAASLAAVVLVVLAMDSYAAVADPLRTLFCSYSMVLQ